MSRALGADEYRRSAEYVDILLAEPWRVFGPLVAAGLQGVDPAAGLHAVPLGSPEMGLHRVETVV